MSHQHSSTCGCSSEVSVDNLASLYNLYSKINKEALECLNENVENAGKQVFRPWDQRLIKDQVNTLTNMQNFVDYFIDLHKIFKWLGCREWCWWGTAIQYPVSNSKHSRYLIWSPSLIFGKLQIYRKRQVEGSGRYRWRRRFTSIESSTF